MGTKERKRKFQLGYIKKRQWSYINGEEENERKGGKEEGTEEKK